MNAAAPKSPPSRAAILIGVTLGIVILVNLISRQWLGVIVNDQAEQVVYSQDWRLVYDEQMPVYQWMTNILLRLTDYWVLTQDLVKYVWLILTAVCLYRLGQRMSGAATGGTLAVLFAFLLPTVNEDLLREYSHSAALIAFTVMSMLYFVKEGRERPRFETWAPGLALIWALGIYSKHSMMIFIAAEIAAFAWLFRPRWPELRSLITTAGAALLAALPIYLIIAFHQTVVAEGVEEFMGEGSPMARFRGLTDFAGSLPAEGALLFLACGIGYLFARGKAGTTVDQNTRLIFWMNVATVLLFVLGVVISNASVFRDRWLSPALILFAPVAARWFIFGLKARTARILAVSLSVVLLIIGFERAAEPLLNRGSGKIDTENLPLRAIARAVGEVRDPGEIVVAANQSVAGTIKMMRPDLVVYSPWTIENLAEDADDILLVTTQKPSIKPLNFPDEGWSCEMPHEFYLPYHLVTEGTFRFELSHCRKG